MVQLKELKNPFILFSPFLLFYILLVITLPTHGVDADEARYLMFARNLLHGFYSPPAPGINLWNGPGYPIILMPFVALKLPLISITLLNALLYYLSIVFLFKSLLGVVRFRTALILSIFWACYYNSYREMREIMTETFTSFLICLIMYCLIKVFEIPRSSKEKKYMLAAGFFLGFLVLTKIMFAYVLFFLQLGFIFLFMVNKKWRATYRKSIVIVLIAFATTLPYLIYTFNITGRPFYWGNGGGMSLYWMSTPFEGEYGDGEWTGDLQKFVPEYQDSSTTATLKLRHQKDYDEVFKHKGIEQDDAFKRIAVRNIKEHPLKYAQNIFCNVARLFFSYPKSYNFQTYKTLVRIPLGVIIAIFIIYSSIQTFINRRKISFSLQFMLLLVFIYLAGSILVTTNARFLTVIVPIILFWTGYVADKTLIIKTKFEEEINTLY